MLALVIGVPWYFFSAHLIATLTVHLVLATFYFILVGKIFGCGSAIASFLLIFLWSTIAGLLLVGFNGGKLFNSYRISRQSPLSPQVEDWAKSKGSPNQRGHRQIKGVSQIKGVRPL